jgi:Zn-finger nucleic acid-binding protein
MQCRACGAVLDAKGVFPGVRLRCVCGAETEVPAPHTLPESHVPYRSAEPRPPDDPPAAKPGPLGPLCPRCTRLLHPGDDGLSCAACRGAFVTHGVLATLVDARRPGGPPLSPPEHARSPSHESSVHYARCPTCGNVMKRMNFGSRSGVIVDVCADHGTWFDGGELDAILEFVSAGGLEHDIQRAGARAPTDDTRELARQAEKMLALEAQQQQRTVQEVTEVADDLVFFLFGGYGGRSRWRRRL